MESKQENICSESCAQLQRNGDGKIKKMKASDDHEASSAECKEFCVLAFVCVFFLPHFLLTFVSFHRVVLRTALLMQRALVCSVVLYCE